jgi:hypothetical protein
MKYLFCLALAGCSSQPMAVVGVGSGGPDIPDMTVLDPLNAASVCTSGNMWTFGDSGSDEMHPGGACIDCHSGSSRAPQIPVGGTVFPTGHEPTDCDGVDGIANVITVQVTDANGMVYKSRANGVGNFYINQKYKLAFPITAKVVLPDGRERVMTESQMTGDCNSCHTQDGTMNAPGRIVPPI